MMVRTQLLTLYRQRLLFWLVGVGIVVILPTVGFLLGSLLDDGSGAMPGGPGDFLGAIVFGVGSVGAAVIGMVVGATAGSRDYSSGVMRDYVLTGVPRWQVHLSQFLAALIVVLGLLAASGLLLILAAVAVDLSSVRDTADAVRGDVEFGDFVRSLLAAVAVVVVLVLGSHSIGSLVRSRGIAIAIIAGYLLIADNIIAAITGGAGSFTQSMFVLFETVFGGGDSTPYDDSATPIIVAIVWLVALIVAPIVRLYRSSL